MIELLGNLPVILGAALALIVGVFGYGKLERRKGRKEGEWRASRHAQAEAEKRKGKRREIDADTDIDDARKRLRDHWTD